MSRRRKRAIGAPGVNRAPEGLAAMKPEADVRLKKVFAAIGVPAPRPFIPDPLSTGGPGGHRKTPIVW